MTPIQIFHITHGYRVFSRYWWQRLLAYPFTQFWRDLYQAYHRMRYGWAPRDVWNLDHYLDRVLADTLDHLADSSHGTPANYPHKQRFASTDIEADHDQWKRDLRRWSAVFRACHTGQEQEWSGWQQRESNEERRTRVLVEMSYWWSGLWE